MPSQSNIRKDIKFYFGKRTNKFCAIFFKLLSGTASKSEIVFAKKYAKDYSNKIINNA